MAPGTAGLIILEPSRATHPAAKIRAILPTPQADVILLDGGRRQNFHTGMLCQILPPTTATTAAQTLTSPPTPIATLILVETTTDAAAALVLDTATPTPTTTLHPGDAATLKFLELDPTR
jgi:hypothetical protein